MTDYPVYKALLWKLGVGSVTFYYGTTNHFECKFRFTDDSEDSGRLFLGTSMRRNLMAILDWRICFSSVFLRWKRNWNLRLVYCSLINNAISISIDTNEKKTPSFEWLLRHSSMAFVNWLDLSFSYSFLSHASFPLRFAFVLVLFLFPFSSSPTPSAIVWLLTKLFSSLWLLL